MKLFFHELSHNYESYEFGYSVRAEPEAESFSEMLNQGFLPYSGNPQDSRNLFYMARSLRIDLETFGWDKKRRYEQRQFHKQAVSVRKIPFTQKLKTENSALWKMAETWMSARQGTPYLNRVRFDYICAKPFLNQLLMIEMEGQPIAFAFINQDVRAAHYWFCFFNPNALQGIGLGQATLGVFLETYKALGCRYAYLGTAYSSKAAYKFKGTQGVQYWTGVNWDSDREKLIECLNSDSNKD